MRNKCKQFAGNIIKGQAKWSDSPHLNPGDFFLWRYLESNLYSNRPQSIEQLKDAIRQELTVILHDAFHSV